MSQSPSTQLAYITFPETLRRLFINRGFPWNENETLDDSTLEPLEIPGEWMGSAHYRIKSCDVCLYILDQNVNLTLTIKILNHI